MLNVDEIHLLNEFADRIIRKSYEEYDEVIPSLIADIVNEVLNEMEDED